MSNPPPLQIQLQEPVPALLPGDAVQGHVVLTIAQPLRIRHDHLVSLIAVYFSCTSGVSLKGQILKENSHHKEALRLYSQTAGDVRTYPAGRHLLPFAFTVPLTAPPSYPVGSGGCFVLHMLDAWVEVGDGKTAYECKKEVQVFTDPRSYPPRPGLEKHFSKTLSTPNHAPGAVQVVLRVPSTGFSLEDNVLAQAKVENNTQLSAYRVTLAIERDETWEDEATAERKGITTVVAQEQVAGELKAGARCRCLAKLPLLTPSSVRKPTITGLPDIKVKYRVQVQATFRDAGTIAFVLPIVVNASPPAPNPVVHSVPPRPASTGWKFHEDMYFDTPPPPRSEL
ncbi:Arrestin domain-containing protein 1 [Sorochytrium milnesiophthora]